MPFGLDPLVFGLIVGLVLGALIEILIVLGPGRYFIAKKARKENLESLETGEWDPALKRVLKPIREQITQEITALKAALKAELTPEEVPEFSKEFEAFEARFSAAYTADMLAIQEEMKKIPLRVSGMVSGEKGNEKKALQAYLDREGVEIDQAVEAAEGQFMVENPETMAALAFKKAYEADVSDEWRAENPIKAGLWDAAKARFLPELQAAFVGRSGPPRLGAGNRKVSSGKIYGT